MAVMAATDFFTVEVLTLKGLMTCDSLKQPVHIHALIYLAPLFYRSGVSINGRRTKPQPAAS
jgi:hypothetical protein